MKNMVCVGIGSNIEPERHIRIGLAELRQRFGPLIVSTVYANAAVGFTGDDFLNLAVRFDTDLPIFMAERLGCYQWGLVSGRTQCRFPWSNKPGGAEDPKTGWFHDILYADGTPYRVAEVEAIKTTLRPAKGSAR